jgi:hypothetical protein
MSGRFDRHSSETEGSSRADGAEGGTRPAMAGVIGASGSHTSCQARIGDEDLIDAAGGRYRQLLFRV